MEVKIDPVNFIFTDPIAVDVETDEKDNFVGLGVSNGEETFYFSKITDGLKAELSGKRLIGHNLKFDLKLLKKWGFDVSEKNILADTMLMSYSMNSVKESHALKDLAKEYLGLEWKTYKEMVHPESKNKKVTLDQQPVEKVADYCGMDAYATYKLWEVLNRKMSPSAKHTYQFVELPLMKVLYQMELKGILIDEKELDRLTLEFSGRASNLQATMKQYFDGNVNSPKQLLPFVHNLGFKVTSTDKQSLSGIKHPFIHALLEYKKVNKLLSTYLLPFRENPSFPKIYTEYNQVSKRSNESEEGIKTGRLSSRNPNLQNIPTRGEDGAKIRSLFISEKGQLFVFDYSQIEYRLLAHFTKEPILIKAFQENKDVHEETGRLLGCTRDIGKTLNFASIYGAGAKKIAYTAKVSEEEAQAFLDEYWKKLPRVQSWINRIKFEARGRKGVFTLGKRFIPLTEITSSTPKLRYHAERAAVNYIIQGSAAEIIKKAMISLAELGLIANMTVHDELVFDDLNNEQVIKVKDVMENVVQLEVPLVVDFGQGRTWNESKKPKTVLIVSKS